MTSFSRRHRKDYPLTSQTLPAPPSSLRSPLPVVRLTVRAFCGTGSSLKGADMSLIQLPASTGGIRVVSGYDIQ